MNSNSIKGKYSKPGVSVISIINHPDNINKVFDNYVKQNYKKKELIIILNATSMDLKKHQKKAKQYDNIKVFKLNRRLNNGECKNFAFKHVTFDYIAFFDNGFYSPNYLNEAIRTFEIIDCDIVGKFTTYVYFVESKILAIKNWIYDYENQYSPGVDSSTMVFKRRLLNELIFPNTKFAENKFQIYCLNYGFKIYSTDKYDYIKHITPDSIKENNLKIEDKDFLEEYKIIAEDIIDYPKYTVLKNNKKDKYHNKRNRNNNKKNGNSYKKTKENSGWGSLHL